MSVERAAGYSPEEYEPHFEYDTPYHMLQEAIVHDWEERGVPVRAATVEEDERGSLRSTRGFDLVVSGTPVPLDLTSSSEKLAQEATSGKRGQEKIVVEVPISAKEFKDKKIKEILENRQLFSDLSRDTLRNLFLSLPEHESKALVARLEARIGNRRGR